MKEIFDDFGGSLSRHEKLELINDEIEKVEVFTSHLLRS